MREECQMLQRSRSDADFSKRTLSEDAQMERLSDSGLNYGRDDGPMDHLDVMNSDRSRASTDEIHEKHDYEDSCASSGVSASSATSVMSVAGDEAIRRLEEELKMTRLALLEKEERCSRLSSMQTTVDTEVHELTEKLFQEAYKMVNLAEERKEKAEKLLKESRMKVDVLQAEVEALKLLVSTPGAGGQHHTNHTSGKGKPSVFSKLLNNWVSRAFTPAEKTDLPSTASTPSHHKKSWQNDGNVPMSKKSQSLPTTIREQQERAIDEAENTEEIDPVFYREFVEWRDAGHPLSWPSDSSSTPTTSNAPSQNNNNFICRIQREEVDPCMSFDNTELATSLITAIRGNCIEIEPVNEEKPSVRNCALTAVPRFCPFRARASPDDEWHFISVLSRNRIAAVCDFHTYLRYVSLGIVRSGIRDTYFDVIALRKNMALARLGLGFIPKTTDQRNC